jgi:hypothetical protein
MRAITYIDDIVSGVLADDSPPPITDGETSYRFTTLKQQTQRPMHDWPAGEGVGRTAEKIMLPLQPGSARNLC